MCGASSKTIVSRNRLSFASMTADYCKRHTYPRTKDYVAAQQIPPSMAWGRQTIKSASIAPVASDVADATAAAARGMPPSRE